MKPLSQRCVLDFQLILLSSKLSDCLSWQFSAVNQIGCRFTEIGNVRSLLFNKRLKTIIFFSHIRNVFLRFSVKVFEKLLL